MLCSHNFCIILQMDTLRGCGWVILGKHIYFTLITLCTVSTNLEHQLCDRTISQVFKSSWKKPSQTWKNQRENRNKCTIFRIYFPTPLLNFLKKYISNIHNAILLLHVVEKRWSVIFFVADNFFNFCVYTTWAISSFYKMKWKITEIYEELKENGREWIWQ